jgi:hypothetical protein
MRKTGRLLLLAAAIAAPAGAEVRSGDRLCGAIAVSSPDRPHSRERFSASKTLDLLFKMRLRNADEDSHVVSFRIVTPNGHLYQEIQVAHAGDSGKRVARLSGRLPVAGTAIATNSLYGRWRVVPYLDGSARPCGTAAVFTIVR